MIYLINKFKNINKNSNESVDAENGVLGLIVLGGGGYLLYSKFKNKNNILLVSIEWIIFIGDCYDNIWSN